ncbi:MAG TPA: hypothetical protein VH186_00120 [Chloroflexia bacterium]|nr:hypothetical protein [Chloroflexia bacterium]
MELAKSLHTLKRNWLLFALLPLIAGAVSTLLVVNRSITYEASAMVQVSFTTNNPVEGVPDYETRDTIFSTILEASTTDVALRSIGEKNHWDTSDLKSMRQAVKVLQVNKSEFIKITVDGKTEKQSIDTANQLADYIRNFSNQRWASQLQQNNEFTEGQLKLAQANYDQAKKEYDAVLKKYKDLQDKAESDRQNEVNQQLQLASDAYKKAQADYATALANPADTVSIELTRNALDRAQRELEAAQLAVVTPIDQNRQAQLNSEFNQQVGLDQAQNNLQTSKAHLDELQTAKDNNGLLLNLPDLHIGSVTVSETARIAEPQSRQVVFFIGLPVGAALVLGVLLLLLLNRIDRRVYNLEVARKFYPWRVIGGVPVLKTQKRSKALPANSLVTLDEPSMENYRRIAYNLIANHREELLSAPTESEMPEPASVESDEESAEALISPNSVSLVKVESSISPVQPGVRVLVTTGLTRNGSTTMVKNLGIALAEAGCQTLLVDCNRKNPGLLTAFNLEDTATEGQVYHTERPRLDILAYSSLPAQSSGLVRLSDLTTILNELPQAYQVILCDTPALEVASDALVLAQYFHNVLFLVNGRKPQVELDQERIHHLLAGSVCLEGLVVNTMDK